jgi:hypothetical protein
MLGARGLAASPTRRLLAATTGTRAACHTRPGAVGPARPLATLWRGPPVVVAVAPAASSNAPGAGQQRQEQQQGRQRRAPAPVSAMAAAADAPAARETGDARSHTTDVVIIGSGIGGLCCGALLAKYGLSVTVCESHTILGGAAHAWVRLCLPSPGRGRANGA